MVDLPQRFVPTSSKLIRHANAVLQCGHDAPVECVKFSPNLAYIASVDTKGKLLVWAFETLDVLGAYHLDFACDRMEWQRGGRLACFGDKASRVIEFDVDDASLFSDGMDAIDPSRVIRFIGTPEVEVLPGRCVVRYGDDVFEHEMEDVRRAVIEPCERYAVMMSRGELRLVAANEPAELLRLPAPEGAAWLDFVVARRGDWVVALLDDSTVCYVDPVKLTSKNVPLRSGRVTACDLENDAFIAWGNDAGNVVVYDVSRRKACFRTARKPLDFIAAYPSPDKFGFLGLRAESAAAFLGASNEILPSDPLPAGLVSSCAGETASEFLAACRDGRIYQIQLNSGSIRAIADTSGEVIAMCAAGDARAYCDVNGRLSAFSNGSRQTVVAESIPLPTKLAVSENAALVACLYENEIVVYGVRKGAQPQRFAVAHAVDIAFAREKTSQNLVIFKDDLSIETMSLKDASPTFLCRVDIPHGTYISYAYAPKSSIFGLFESEQGHKVVVKANLRTGKVSEVLRILTCGRQIWAAAPSPETLLLRSDISSVKIVSGFKAYSFDDWTRCEPLEGMPVDQTVPKPR